MHRTLRNFEGRPSFPSFSFAAQGVGMTLSHAGCSHGDKAALHRSPLQPSGSHPNSSAITSSVRAAFKLAQGSGGAGGGGVDPLCLLTQTESLVVARQAMEETPPRSHE